MPAEAPSLVAVSRALAAEIAGLRFSPPVDRVYNPLDYAQGPHERYLERYGGPPREVVLLGMNPGPFGMAQTGVPFGDPELVREWLGIDLPVGQPTDPHPRRPVQGFSSRRREVSGSRLWGWARQRFGTPEHFFRRFLVLNYCPLCFLEESGRNRTPDRLPREEAEPLLAACDRALLRAVESLSPRWVVGVGNYASRRARAALVSLPVRVGGILHPSPASPAANRGWAAAAEAQLRGLGIDL